jgi:hypothetical protein
MGIARGVARGVVMETQTRVNEMSICVPIEEKHKNVEVLKGLESALP